jgi:hypothetical protein
MFGRRGTSSRLRATVCDAASRATALRLLIGPSMKAAERAQLFLVSSAPKFIVFSACGPPCIRFCWCAATSHSQPLARDGTPPSLRLWPAGPLDPNLQWVASRAPALCRYGTWCACVCGAAPGLGRCAKRQHPIAGGVTARRCAACPSAAQPACHARREAVEPGVLPASQVLPLCQQQGAAPKVAAAPTHARHKCCPAEPWRRCLAAAAGAVVSVDRCAWPTTCKRPSHYQHRSACAAACPPGAAAAHWHVGANQLV